MNNELRHSLLRRQLKRFFGNSFTIPSEWKQFINAVDEAYKENDIDRGMLERSLDLSSHELLHANSEMRKFNIELENIVAMRTRELQEANEQLKELDKLKTDFVSSVSHELRTPLTAVIGFMHIIKDRLSNIIFPTIDNTTPPIKKVIDKVHKEIDIILSEGERLTTLVNDLLDITKMESGKMEWDMDIIDIHEVVEHAVAATNPLFRQKKLALTLAFNAEKRLVIGDRNRLIQVMINLISNAVKFTESGGITIKTTSNEETVVIGVKDTGIGIKSTDQQRIFEKFSQVGETLIDKPMGTGLGLHICKHIIDCHNGEIWVESILGEGSLFNFSVPLIDEETKKFFTGGG